MAWENTELYDDAANSETKIDIEYKNNETDHDNTTGGEDTRMYCSLPEPTRTHSIENGSCEKVGQTHKATKRCGCIIGLVTVVVVVVTCCICLAFTHTEDSKSAYSESHNDTTNSSISQQNYIDTPHRPKYQSRSQADVTTERIWMKAEYISTTSDHQIVWRPLSVNNGSNKIHLIHSSTSFLVPVSGQYSILATFQIVGRTCKIVRNSNHASIRLCLQHEHNTVKCIKESFPESSAEFWVRTVHVIVPALFMETEDTVTLVTSNPTCIYDDPVVSLMEIHRID